MAVELEDITVSPENLLLDPNNPRFADFGIKARVPDYKVMETGVQQRALAAILDPRYEVEELKEGIENVGFLSMDRMVVVELPEDSNYMVIEGNRRLAAIKSLLEDATAGHTDLKPSVEESLKSISVLVIKGTDREEQEEFARTLQGIRHIAGIRPWGPYQQAQAVGQMLSEGMDVPSIKSALGLTTNRVNLLRSAYFGMREMEEDPHAPGPVKAEYFSHFVEALKQPKIRDWLEWSREEGSIRNEDRRHFLYGWIVGMEDEDGVKAPPKIIDAKDFRLLPAVMEDAVVLERFMNEPRLTLQDASRLLAPDPEPPAANWRPAIRRNLALLNGIPHSQIAQATDEDIQLLTEARDACSQLLHDIEVLQNPGS